MSEKREIFIDGYPVKNYGCVGGGFPSGGHKALIPLLIKKFGVCYHCGIKVRRWYKASETMPPDAATIDHLKSRWERMPNEIVEKVLACYRCNGKRGKMDEKNHKRLAQQQLF